LAKKVRCSQQAISAVEQSGLFRRQERLKAAPLFRAVHRLILSAR
jgi:hypothetical protein